MEGTRIAGRPPRDRQQASLAESGSLPGQPLRATPPVKSTVACTDEVCVSRILATLLAACAAAVVASPAATGYPQELAESRQPGPDQVAVVVLTNQARAAGAWCAGRWYGPAGPLSWNAKLGLAAARHSRDMATRDYFAHTSPQGRTAFDRIRAAGYQYRRAGENIAAGRAFDSPAAVVAAWLNSPAHCQVLMNPQYTEVGVARADGPGSYSTYWTQAFGVPRRAAAPVGPVGPGATASSASAAATSSAMAASNPAIEAKRTIPRSRATKSRWTTWP